MKKLLGILAIWLSLGAAPTFAANVNIDGLPAAGSVGGTDLLECEQAGTNRKCTAAQTAAYVNSLFSGDFTAAAGGAATFATVNANVGSFGSTTNCVTLTVNAKGLITAASAATCAPAVGSITGLGTGVATFLATPSSANLLAALTTKTGTGSAVFGSAPTIDSLSATTAMTLSFLTGGGTQCLTVSNTGAVGGTACAGGGSVTSVTPGAGQVSSVTAACSQTAITVTGTISSAECVNAQVGTTYTIVDGDRAKLVTGSNTASQAYSIAQAGASTTFQSGWFVRVRNVNTGPIVITPTTSTINGAATYTVLPGQTVKITSDGTNYQTDAGSPTAVAVASQTGANYAFKSGDYGTLVNLSNASAQIPTMPQAGTTGIPPGWYVQACNQGAGTQTITPTTSTIGGASTYVLPAASAAAPACVGIVSDGTNYQVVPDTTVNASYLTAGTLAAARGGAGTINGALKGNGSGVVSQAACADLSNAGALCPVTPGTGVATAAAANLSAAGGLTTTIGSTTIAMATSAIASGACTAAQNATVTNTATTDVVLVGFNGDPTAVTGFAPATAGMLTVIAYPTANTVVIKECNNTASSITPGAHTFNIRVVR